jgi:hypothetical protein
MGVAMKSFIRNVVLYTVNAVLFFVTKFISSTAEDLTKNNILLSVSILACGMVLLFISYRRHESKAGEASDEALWLANNPAMHRSEWDSLIQQSSQAWPWEGRAIDFIISMTMWITAGFIALVFFSHYPAWVFLISPVLTLTTKLTFGFLKSRRQDAKFEEDLRAANEGRLEYSDESPEEETTIKTSVKDFAADLPKEIMTEAAKSIFRFK